MPECFRSLPLHFRIPAHGRAWPILVHPVLWWNCRRRTRRIRRYEELVLGLLLLLHAPQATFHTLHIVVYLGRSIVQSVVVRIADLAVDSHGCLCTRLLRRRLIDLIESFGRPYARGCCRLVGRVSAPRHAHILQRGHDIVHRIGQWRRCEIAFDSRNRRRRFGGMVAIARRRGRRCSTRVIGNAMWRRWWRR
jgi:hypothetical protein